MKPTFAAAVFQVGNIEHAFARLHLGRVGAA